MKQKSSVKSSGKDASPGIEPLYEKIARKAYEIYEESGWEDGKDIEHWLEAEKLVAGSQKKK